MMLGAFDVELQAALAADLARGVDENFERAVARQVVGMLARRVVCRIAPGADVRAGDRFGIMKFGSRMDVFMPKTAEIRVAVGDMVRGGETVIAVLHSN